MKLLITGGMGFIGSNFIRHILNKYPDYQIINFDKLTYAGNPENLRDIDRNRRYGFVKGDIVNEELVDFLVKRKPDAIINFAAETHVDRSIGQARDFIITDILGTFSLLEAAKKYEIEKFIQISTDEVYGSIEEGSFLEEDALDPSSPYSASKAGADMVALAYHRTYGLPVTITRSSNNFGPYQYPEKIIPLFITNLLEDKKIPIYGDGSNVRDWLYVLDNCAAIDTVLHYGKPGEVYNIGSSNELTNLELSELLLEILDKDESSIQYVKDRPGHDKRYSVDWSKLRELGWWPKHTFKEALKDTVKWYQENMAWWQPIKEGEFKEYYRKQYGR